MSASHIEIAKANLAKWLATFIPFLEKYSHSEAKIAVAYFAVFHSPLPNITCTQQLVLLRTSEINL